MHVVIPGTGNSDLSVERRWRVMRRLKHSVTALLLCARSQTIFARLLRMGDGLTTNATSVMNGLRYKHSIQFSFSFSPDGNPDAILMRTAEMSTSSQSSDGSSIETEKVIVMV